MFSRFGIYKSILVLLCLLLSAEAISQTLSSTVDRNRLSANQTLRLTLSYDGSTRTDALDLSALEQDFDIVSRSSGTSYQLSNNERARSTTWELVLIPKRTGRLVVPSFSLGNIISDAIQIDVVAAGEVADDDDPMSVTLKLDRESAKVGEQVLVTVTLRARTFLADLGGEELKVDNADIKLVSQKDFGEVKNGINWRVIEWTYALFPQTNDSIVIPRQLFTAIIPSTRQRSFLDSFALRGQRIARRSEPAAIKISEGDNLHDWFPASNVSIESNWTSDPKELRVGEPMTRMVTVKAESQLAAGIPPSIQVSAEAPTRYKEYQDQPSLENTETASGITGVRTESSAIVPSKDGTIVFPEQVVHWWDINAKTWKESVLPEERYEVLPAVQGQNFSPPQPTSEPVSAGDVGFGEDASLFGKQSGAVTLRSSNDALWRWATIALAIIVVVQGILLIRSKNRTAATQKPAAASQNESEKHAWRALLTAIDSNKADQIRSAIVDWSRTKWPKESVHTLSSLASKSASEDFRCALGDLERIIFKDDNSLSLNTDALKSGLDDLRSAPEAKNKPASELSPLYPASP